METEILFDFAHMASRTKSRMQYSVEIEPSVLFTVCNCKYENRSSILKYSHEDLSKYIFFCYICGYIIESKYSVLICIFPTALGIIKS